MNKEFICIICPRGCHVHVDEQMNITGNKCKRGIDYVLAELNEPKRILTSTVKTIFSDQPRISVKTDQPIPKDKIYEVMDILAEVTIDQPMSIGEVLIENILGTGSNIVLTKSCRK